jgi:hypothetical protein
MNRPELQQLAEDRLIDAQALLAAGRWSAAYYLPGYAVECGLKSCVLVRIMNTGVIFEDKKFGERCWTHNFEELLELADLGPVLGREVGSDAIFRGSWIAAKEWTETTRYQQISQPEAVSLVQAIAEPTHGVMQWIRKHW